MIVSHAAVKDTLFGKFLGCLLAGIGPKILELDLAKLEPKCTLNGHEVDVRIAFERFEEALRSEEGFEGALGNLSRSPVTPRNRSSLESSLSDAREYLDSVESEIEEAYNYQVDVDHLTREIVDNLWSSVRETVYDTLISEVGNYDLSSAESALQDAQTCLTEATSLLEEASEEEE